VTDTGIDAELLAKIKQADIANIARKARDGKTLTAAEIRRLESATPEDDTEPRATAAKYTRKEVARHEGVTDQAVYKWGKAELERRGWQKHGKGRGLYYTRSGTVAEVSDNRHDLELRKMRIEIARMEADANLKNQKLAEVKRALFLEWTEAFSEEFIEAFTPLRDRLNKLRLTKDDANEWNAAIEDCLQRLLKASARICAAADTKTP